MTKVQLKERLMYIKLTLLFHFRLTLQMPSGCFGSNPLHKTPCNWIFYWIQGCSNFLTFPTQVLEGQWNNFWCFWLSKSVRNQVFLSASHSFYSIATTQMTANLLWVKYFKTTLRQIEKLFSWILLTKGCITNVGLCLKTYFCF